MKCPAANATTLDFSRSVLENNNLGGGSVTDAENIYLASVGMLDNMPVDLNITALGDYVPRDQIYNTLIDGFMQLNLDENQTSDLLFEFVHPITKAPVELNEFVITFYDIDLEHKRHRRGVESVTASGFDQLALDPNTQVKVSSGPGSATTFSAEETGGLSDNPTDPTELTSIQLARAVSLTYRATSSIAFTFATSSTKYGGRNFIFAGGLPFLDPCCLAPSPPFLPSSPTPPPPPLTPPPACGAYQAFPGFSQGDVGFEASIVLVTENNEDCCAEIARDYCAVFINSTSCVFYNGTTSECKVTPTSQAGRALQAEESSPPPPPPVALGPTAPPSAAPDEPGVLYANGPPPPPPPSLPYSLP